MTLLTKEALLGASDLIEREIELPSIGGSVRIRSLSASFSNQAQTDAVGIATDRHGEQSARVDVNKLEALQVLHGLVDPQLDTIDEAVRFQQQVGPAWHTLVRAIGDISGISQEAIEKTSTMFQPGGQGETGTPESNGVGSGDGGSDIPARVGA